MRDRNGPRVRRHVESIRCSNLKNGPPWVCSSISGASLCCRVSEAAGAKLDPAEQHKLDAFSDLVGRFPTQGVFRGFSRGRERERERCSCVIQILKTSFWDVLMDFSSLLKSFFFFPLPPETCSQKHQKWRWGLPPAPRWIWVISLVVCHSWIILSTLKPHTMTLHAT